MKIRIKMALIVLPLIIVPLFLSGIASSLAARNGITQVTTKFLQFKAEQLEKYAESQWNLLVENNLASKEEYIQVSKTAVDTFARSLIRNTTELIFALNSNGEKEMMTRDLSLTPEDNSLLLAIMENEDPGWRDLLLSGTERVSHSFFFEPFGWFIFVTEEKESFYKAINQIYVQSGIILAVSLFFTVILLFVLTNRLTKPLSSIVKAMKNIMGSTNFSQKVELLYHDETGELAHTFNLMTDELEKAYDEIKIYALETAISQRKEQKIRSIFQRYVPKDVIDQYFKAPESMLEGEDRILAVLFADIRKFTTISETLPPKEIVESLNMYFGTMVNIIMNHGGIVDKYIGDAIMAFFGAPVKHDDDAYKAILSGLEMLDAVSDFNIWQNSQGRPEFKIGIGINYGVVTVGNIGTERKMDYTVIGDMVNLASRLEGLTKMYQETLLFSESVQRKISGKVPCRMIDRVAVKGKATYTNIYTAKRKLSKTVEKAWDVHHLGMKHYYSREFKHAANLFDQAHKLLPEDYISDIFFQRCQLYMSAPPPEDWNGIVFISEK